MGPRDHRIHLGRRDSPASSPQNHSLTKLCFSGPQNHPKNIPGPKCHPGGPKIRSGPPKSTPGHEKTKDARRNSMQNPALEKSNGAMPYGASYGPKLFRAGLLNVAIFCYVVLFVSYCSAIFCYLVLFSNMFCYFCYFA